MPAAREDLIDIADFIAADNPARAQTFVDELEAECRALGNAPGTGTARPALDEGLRMLPCGRHLVFYRPTDTALRIERILHGARDIGILDLEADAP